MRDLPPYFRLKDLSTITAPVFELGYNPHQKAANLASEQWFTQIGAYHGRKLSRFLSHRFDDFAGLSFPNASLPRLVWCINFFFWAFSFDDLSDEGELQDKPDRHELGVNICLSVLAGKRNQATIHYPYAKMLYCIWMELSSSAAPGTRNRFSQAAKDWCKSQVQQCDNRRRREIMSIQDFIIMRRYTIGGAMVEAMVEYSLAIRLPDHVFKHPIIKAMSDATNDIMTWPNDLCSFNKEQADGDNQNLVWCVMKEKNVGLQKAIDIITQMLHDRVDEYAQLKRKIPSFGLEVDLELDRYLKGLEQFVQGTVVWYYSKRYFGDLDLFDRTELVVPVLKRPSSSKSEIVKLSHQPPTLQGLFRTKNSASQSKLLMSILIGLLLFFFIELRAEFLHLHLIL